MRIVIVIVIAVFIYTIQQRIYRRLWDNGLSVSITFDEEYIENGSTTFLSESVTNSKYLPLPVIHVKFATDRSFTFVDNENASVTDSYHRNDVFSIMGNERITRRLEFTAAKRGLYKISAIELVAKDFFMTRSFAKQIKNTAGLYVFPEKYDNVEIGMLCRTLIGELTSNRSLVEDPYTFRGIRDYDASFTMNRINWKASAKTGSMKVNVYDHSYEQKVKLMLDLEPNAMLKIETMQEICIKLASTVAEKLISNNVPTAFVTNGIDEETDVEGRVDVGASKEHMIAIDKCLSRIKGDSGLDGFMKLIDSELSCRDDNISYVIISSYCKEDLLLKLDYLNARHIHFKLIVPYYDIQDEKFNRSYIYGWEVAYDEA